MLFGHPFLGGVGGEVREPTREGREGSTKIFILVLYGKVVGNLVVSSKA